ncbi:carbon-nitrogen hydrolase family protein [Pseudaestuariivita atlantica]|uniref:Amidohydrolase n=1 Tax=Pseudaestuariivita atlantica TaxID=1317121 RepID=A0A0L1JPN1_9RHOB|nr:carbon-nitrogen hydrolase family protein [Pseudaestuariivita atlantica]KNG93672.1 amidohydrolase [Pseudaestuariivita atlantica]
MKAGLVQLNSSDDPAANLGPTRALIAEAAGAGAGFVLTPEVTNCVSTRRARQIDVLQHEADDITLAALRKDAAALGIWLLIGSLALKTDDPDGRFANRSFLIAPDGTIAARYDKIHMFDVTVSETEQYRESAGYRPGTDVALAPTPFARIGMTICYDLRFPYLYRALAQAGAEVLTVPSAFSPVTGDAHWETLLRARAIETGSYVLAPAQTGTHAASEGKPRRTYGHSLAVGPWGEILADGGEDTGITLIDLDRDQVAQARRRIPALTHGTDLA